MAEQAAAEAETEATAAEAAVKSVLTMAETAEHMVVVVVVLDPPEQAPPVARAVLPFYTLAGLVPDPLPAEEAPDTPRTVFQETTQTIPEKAETAKTPSEPVSRLRAKEAAALR